jgi:phage shock protein PspC (stress-responsive transcriptional regulator)
MVRKKKAGKGGAKGRRVKKPSLEERAEDFEQEVESLGRQFERDVEIGEKRIARGWHSTFGFIGPLITSIFGIVLFIIFLWFLGFFAFASNTAFLLAIRYFLASNLGLFFLLFLLFGYADYFKRISPKAYRAVWPLVSAAKFAATVWVIASVIVISGIGCGAPLLRDASVYALGVLPWIFVFIAALGYLVLALSPRHGMEKGEIQMASRQKKGGIKRLYRSGRDKVLGGVCGGIAEYLNVDPVIIRLIWVVGALIWGAGIVLYIIAWIIIPRNPEDKWK